MRFLQENPYTGCVFRKHADLQYAYYNARRTRIAAREHYDAAVCEEQRLAQKLWNLLKPEDDGA